MSLIIIDPDGSKRGADPREISKRKLEREGIVGRPILDVIRAKCLDCCCDQRAEVAACVITACALWPFRMRTNPFRAPREMTEEQRTASGARLLASRRAKAGADD